MSTLEIPVAVTVDRLVEAIEHLPSQELDRGEKGLGQRPCTWPHLSWTDRYRVQDKCLCPSQCKLAFTHHKANLP